MNYIDSGNRHASQAFGTWLDSVLTDDVSEIRWQSGFFSADALGILETALQRLAGTDSPVKALIGSNDQGTSRAHVEQLLTAIQIPRAQGRVGVVSFQNSYFHPKTFHVCRSDGTQAGYVGSANFTVPGISSLHVEAGITLDSRDGDPTPLLNNMALAVDSWFSEERLGFYQVNGEDDVRGLTERGVISEMQRVRATPSGSTTPGGSTLARLQPLFNIPRNATRSRGNSVITPTAATVRGILLPSVPRSGFPQYLLFAPGADAPTSGDLALSGAGLPAGVAGLVVRLNRDSSRHFEGRSGTANISIPVATIGSFRFGMYKSKFIRPRVEFPLELRYMTNESILGPLNAATNIMAYGFIPGESGHGDVRMVIPAACRHLVPEIRSSGGTLPDTNDVAVLEWPTASNGAVFRLTFLDRGCDLHTELSSMLDATIASGTSVGGGTCWLPNTVVPNYSSSE